MSEVVQEWILYSRNTYADRLLYVKSVEKINGVIVITELTKDHKDTKRFKSRKTAHKVAAKTDSKVALLERKLDRPSIYERDGGV